MIRQSQNYFAAAVSAAILNAAAIAAFVVFTMLSSAGGFPLQDLFGSGNTITPASSPAPSGDGEASRFVSPNAAFGSPSATPGTASDGPVANTQLNGADRPPNGSSDVGPRSGGVGSAPSGGDRPARPGAAAAGGSTGGTSGGGGALGGIGGGGSLPGLPQQPPVSEQVGSAVSQVPAAVNQGVGNAVDTADAAVGGSLSDAGVAGAVKGASASLLGQSSSQAGALQGTPLGG